MPQVLVTVGISLFASINQSQLVHWWAEGGVSAQDVDFKQMGTLLAFLIIFKTNWGVLQFWTALKHTDEILHLSRSLARLTCAAFQWEKGESHALVRRLLRYEVAFWYILTEYLQRSGAHEVDETEIKNNLRARIHSLLYVDEVRLLYPDDADICNGADSHNPYANPQQVLVMMQHIVIAIYREGGISPPPILSSALNSINGLDRAFWSMEKLDKVLFPLPYNQIVKLLILTFTFLTPFTMVPACGWATPFIMFFVALGFFGLDEAAEVLEQPFGTDPNQVDLDVHAEMFARDVELCYKSRDLHRTFVSLPEGDCSWGALYVPANALAPPRKFPKRIDEINGESNGKHGFKSVLATYEATPSTVYASPDTMCSEPGRARPLQRQYSKESRDGRNDDDEEGDDDGEGGEDGGVMV
jgi:putative membrane protein